MLFWSLGMYVGPNLELASIAIITVLYTLHAKDTFWSKYTNIKIIVSPMDVVYAVAPEHISMFSMAPYSCKNGDTVQTNPVHEKGTKFFPKQCLSVWLSISVGRTSIVVGVFKFLVEDTEVLIARRFVEETLCILEFHEGGMMLPLWSYVTCVRTDAGGIVTAPIIGFNVLA